MKKILIIGALGQIGSDLSEELKKIYGADNVICSDIKIPKDFDGIFEIVNILDKESIIKIVKKYKIDVIINLAAILSANAEKDHLFAWDVNINGFYNILEIAREYKIEQVLNPSSIAVFGPTTPRDNTPQETVLQPTTIYGISKVSGELLAEYYINKFGIDVRGLRYPGIISYKTLPGGGTTDYAVAIFYEAIKNKHYTSFVNKDTKLPMMYMPDCINSTIQLMQADFNKLKHHADFNVGAMSFTVEELANEIKKHIPDFTIDYKPDERQLIADSWPKSIDDSVATKEWGWKAEYNLEMMTKDMLEKVGEKLKI